MAGTAVAIIAGAPLAAYAAAVVAATAVTATRPAQSTLIPSVAATPDQLTAANVVVGWVEAAGIAAAGLLAGVLISLAGVGSVFAVCAGLGLVAALLIAGLRVRGAGGGAEGTLRPRWPGSARACGWRSGRAAAAAHAGPADRGGRRGGCAGPAVRHPGHHRARPLRRPGPATSTSPTASGAVLAATVSAVLVGRRLGAADPGGGAGASAARWPCSRSAWAWPGRWPCWSWPGPATALLDVASPHAAAALGPGPADRPGLRRPGGAHDGRAGRWARCWSPRWSTWAGAGCACSGVAAVLPLAAVAGGRALFGSTPAPPVPVVRDRAAALAAAVRRAARTRDRRAWRRRSSRCTLAAGTVLIRQGDPGDAYYAIAAGELDVGPGRAVPAPVRPRRGRGRDRAAARHPAHGDRDRAHRRHRVRSWTGSRS